jgi:hypothetical protein
VKRFSRLARNEGRKQESASFLKKSKKLLFVAGVGTGGGNNQRCGRCVRGVAKARVEDKSFLVLFFETERLAFFCACTPPDIRQTTRDANNTQHEIFPDPGLHAARTFRLGR